MYIVNNTHPYPNYTGFYFLLFFAAFFFLYCFLGVKMAT
jgi:hypothetical protein